MRLQTKAPDPRSAHSPSRTAVRASPATAAPSASRATTTSHTAEPGDVTSAHVEAASGEGQADDQERAERATPPIPLTLRAMHGMRHPQARSSGRPAFVLLSVLALLALACFPVLAQAETRVGSSTKLPCPRSPGTPPRTTQLRWRARRMAAARRRQFLVERRLWSDSTPGIRVLGLRRAAHRRRTAIQARAAVKAPARVAQATVRPPGRTSRRTPASQGQPSGTQTSSSDEQLFFAPGPDPDRDRRARGDLDRCGRDQAAAPAPRLPARQVSPKAS